MDETQSKANNQLASFLHFAVDSGHAVHARGRAVGEAQSRPDSCSGHVQCPADDEPDCFDGASADRPPGDALGQRALFVHGRAVFPKRIRQDEAHPKPITTAWVCSSLR
jgi:hypothetical protein